MFNQVYSENKAISSQLFISRLMRTHKYKRSLQKFKTDPFASGDSFVTV